MLCAGFLGCTSAVEPVDAPRYAWVVGIADSTGYATVLRTTNGGETFERQGIGQDVLRDVDLLDVYAVDTLNLWAVGTRNRIVYSTDGGRTWQAPSLPTTDTELEYYSISAARASSSSAPTHYYVSGIQGVVLTSSDGGQSWSLTDTSGFNGSLIQGVRAVTPTRVYLCGTMYPATDSARGFIRVTTNGGSSWDSLQLADDFNRHFWISSAHYGTSMIIYGGTNYYTVSTDNGGTWRNDSTRVAGGTSGGADINHLIMLNESTWMAAMDMGHLIKTTDAGASWYDPSLGLGGTFMLGIDAFDNSNAIAVGETTNFPRRGPMARTTNGGTTWTVMPYHSAALRKVSCVRW